MTDSRAVASGILGRRAAVAIAAALAIAVAGTLAWRSPSLPCGDLCSYYAAGLLAREGSPEAAFDLVALERRHREVHDFGQRVGPFLYSPLFLGPSMALASTPYESAARLHRLAGAVILAAGLFAVLLALDSPAVQIAIAGAFALSHVAWVQLVYANWSFALFALAAIVMLGLVRTPAGSGLRRLAVIGGVLALHLKPYVLFALAPVAVARRRFAAAIAAVALLLAALALPFTGTEPWQRFGAFLAGRGTAGVTPYYSKSSLAANLARTATAPREWVAPRGPVETAPVRAAFWLGLPLLAYGAWRLRPSPEAGFAFGLAWVLLFVPQIWEHTEVLLFAALPALARRFQLALAALLAATLFYNDLQQRLLAAALRGAGETGEAAIQSLLWLYPALNLAVLVAALVRRPRAPGLGDEPVGAPA